MKKILAALTALTLSLLSVVLLPTAASAHHNTITASVSCDNTDGSYTISWTITNSENYEETLSHSSRLSDQIDGVVLGPKGSLTVTEKVTHVNTYALEVTGTWTYNNYSTANTGTINTKAFPECNISVTPPEPTFQDATCTAPGQSSDASYTIPAMEGVYYKVDNHPVQAGTHAVNRLPDEITVKAYAMKGYELSGTKEWEHKFSDPGDCKVDVTPIAPTPVQPSLVCTAPGQSDLVLGSITVPSVEGVIYKLEGQEVSGTLTDLSPGEYHFSVKAADGYKLTDHKGFTIKLLEPEDINCIVDVVPVQPSVVNETCAAPGQQANGSLTFTFADGIRYYVDGVLVENATVSLPDGTYTVSAEAMTGYALSGYDGPWELTITDAGDCIVDVTPVAPTAHAITQCGLYGSIDMPEVTGVVYSLDGNGTTGTNVVTATAAPGYALTDSQSKWTFDLGEYTDCAETPSISEVTPEQCNPEGPGSTPASFTVTEAEGVTYYLDGVMTTGGSLTPGEHTVTAEADEGYSFAPETTTSWTFTVEDVDCRDTVELVAPTFTQGYCENGQEPVDNTYVIPDVTGLQFMADGVNVDPGTYTYASGTLTITFEALEGYKLPGDAPESYTFTFEPVVCNVAVIPTTPSVIDQCGVNADSLAALPDLEGVSYEYTGSFVNEDGSLTFAVTAYPMKGFYFPEGSDYTLVDGVAYFEVSTTNVPCEFQPGTYAVPSCVLDAPWVDYNLVVPDAVDTSGGAKITFVNPSGPDYVLTGQPLSGRLLWPGATIDGDGNGTDWPGWVKASDGTWSQVDDGWAWAAGDVQVIFEVNPSMSVTLSYPPATDNCSAEPVITGSGGAPRSDDNPPVVIGSGAAPRSTLASTGAEIFDSRILWAILGSLIAGTSLMVVFSRRRS